MDKLARLSADDRDNLAAYLDGELDENGTRRIESILTSSTVARNDVEVLARTYELLDLLPRPAGSQDFAEKTIATAKLEGYRQPVTSQAWYQHLVRIMPLAGWSLTFLVVSFLGFTLANQWIPQQHEILLKDLSLIQNLDLYSEVDSIQFLESLSTQKQLLEEMREASQP